MEFTHFLVIRGKWKRSNVISITKKKGKFDKYDSYRSIRLVPTTGKIFEIIISQRIPNHCDENDSTVHAVNKFVSDNCWSLNSQCIGVFDLEKHSTPLPYGFDTGLTKPDWTKWTKILLRSYK